jgi:acylphosphatase
MNGIKRAKIYVFGQVQGVFFRQKTKNEAKSLNLIGWVKNTEDGNVIIMAQGPKECIEAIITWAGVGPLRAKVKKVEVEWLEPSNDLSDFEIII